MISQKYCEPSVCLSINEMMFLILNEYISHKIDFFMLIKDFSKLKEILR